MSALPKIEEILEEIEDIESPLQSEQMEALELLAATLRARNEGLLGARDKLETLNGQLKELRARLEDVNKRLDMTVKSGIGSTSIH